MCRCTCAMLMLLAVCFTESENAQQNITNPVSSRVLFSSDALTVTEISDTTDQRVKLQTACFLDKQCVFEIRGVNFSVLAGALSKNTSAQPCTTRCSSNNPLCSCCDDSVENLREILQACAVAHTNLTELQRDLRQDIQIQEATKVLYDLKLKLIETCSQQGLAYCSSQESCEFIKCKAQPCNPANGTTISTSTATTPPPQPPTPTTTTLSPTTATSGPSKTSTTKPKVTNKKTSSTAADDNNQSQPISTTPTSTATNMKSTNALAAEQGSPNVTAVILGVVVCLLVAVCVAVFLIFWSGRRRAKKGGKSHCSPSTIAFVTAADTGESQYSELSNSVGCRQTADRKTSGAQPNRDSKYDHEYSVIPADVVKFTHPNDLDPGYDVLIDVTKRKLPPAPAQDGEHSLARNPDGEMKKKPPVRSGLKPAVHSLAKTTAIQDLKGKNNAEGERKEKQGQYFVLEKDEDDFDNAEKKDGQYFILEENADGDKQSETGGQYFVVEKESADEKPETGGQYFVLEKESADEKPETGGQYFVLEKESADEKPETGVQYIVLEKESADEKPETGGQYFVLEKDTDSGNDKRENGGQYFVLEKEDADENPETGGQYFILEKDLSDASGQDQTGENKVYSSLNRDDMEPVDAAEQASEYTALNNSRAGTTSPGSQSSVVPQQESVYSLQMPID